MKLPIQITDNNWDGLTIDDEEHLDNLKKIAEKPISEISLDDNPNLLIFPQNLNEYRDKIEKQHVFEVKGGKLCTGNIMGFIGYRNTKVRIHSRFASEKGDYFLHYMLQRVFAINLFDLKYYADDESIFDFLIYLFPAFLKKALKKGLYKEYQTRQYNDANIRGRVEVSRHIRMNTPFNGKIAYSTREYAYDNHITQLVRHTIEYISKHTLHVGILQNDELTQDAVARIREATPSYNQNERRKVINQNFRPLIHPYFNDYRNLQRLCIQILRHDELKYGHDDNEIYGILFDGAWLWEEYLNIILKDCGFIHPQNRSNSIGKYMFKPQHVLLQPDLYIENQIVLDAKYKGHATLFERSQREDRFQLLAYMYIFNTKKSGLIVPKGLKEEYVLKGDLHGIGGQMCLFGVPVSSNCNSFIEYQDYMGKEEKVLIRHIINFMNNILV